MLWLFLPSELYILLLYFRLLTDVLWFCVLLCSQLAVVVLWLFLPSELYIVLLYFQLLMDVL